MEEIPLPRVELGTQPSGAAVLYSILEPQVPSWVFEGGSDDLLDEATARRWIEWLRSTEADRVLYVVGFFASVGAPVVGLLESSPALSALAIWAQSWLPVVFQWRYKASYFDIMHPEKPSSPSTRSVTAEAAVLFQSLVHDFTFVTVATARTGRSELAWRLQQRDRLPRLVSSGRPTTTPRIGYLPALWDDPPWVDPVLQVTFFVNHAALGRGDGPSHALGSGDWLNQLARRLSGEEAPDGGRFIEVVPSPPGELAARLAASARLYRAATTPLRPPRKSDPPTGPDVVAAVAAFRRAGYFARFAGLSDDDMGRAMAAAWRVRQGEELPVDEDELDWAIATLDDERTLYEDPEADVGPGNNAYRAYLRKLAKRSGYPLRITAVKEDWSAQPGSVIISFRSDDEQKSLVLTNCNDWIDPSVVTGLNALLPADGGHFYFVDNGGQMAIVTRTTERERRVLEAATPIRLLTEPPDWWAGALL